MQFIAILITFFSTAAAFSSVGRVSRTKLHMAADFSKEIGAQPPLGFFDPLGLLTDAEQETFDLYRNIELKHGRVSMLAILGHLVTSSGVRLPGEIAYGVPFSSVRDLFPPTPHIFT